MAYRIVILYDIKGWAYFRRAAALARYAPDDFHVDTFPHSRRDGHNDVLWDWRQASEYDLIFNLEYRAPGRRHRDHYAPGVPLVVSYNSDSHRRQEYWTKVRGEADFLVVNNRDMYEKGGRAPRTCAISNGVDLDLFRCVTPIQDRPEKVFWRGSSGIKKGKGWQEVLQPAIPRLRELGFDADFMPIDHIDDRVLDTEPLVDLYNQCSYVVCTSSTEGTPNFMTEGVACGCVPVSTPVGNILEWGRDRENCVLIDRCVESLVEGLLYARDRKQSLHRAAHETIQAWGYGPPANRAQVYFDLFRRILERGVRSVQPFGYWEWPGCFEGGG